MSLHPQVSTHGAAAGGALGVMDMEPRQDPGGPRWMGAAPGQAKSLLSENREPARVKSQGRGAERRGAPDWQDQALRQGLEKV